jgi:heme exporter protein D
MGGYALYVWGSFAVTAVLMTIEVWQARRQHADTLRALCRERDLQAGDAARAPVASSKEMS